MRLDPLSFLTSELDTLKSQGLYRRLRILSDAQQAKTTVDSRVVVNLSSNNYLGLTTHPRLRQRALDAIRRYGVGSGSVRPIAGTLDIHLELEQRYHIEKQWLLNRELRGPGIVSGLEVSRGDGFVTVERGFALDSNGRLLAVSKTLHR